MHVGGVQRLQRLEDALHGVGEGVIGGVHVREQCVAANRRHRAQMQDARHRRLFVGAHVRVPVGALGEGRGRVGVDFHEFRPVVHARRGGVDVELAEAAPELHMLFVVDVLIAEEEHEMFEQPAVQRVERLVVERLAQVHAMHFRADMASERPGNSIVSFRIFSSDCAWTHQCPQSCASPHGGVNDSIHPVRSRLRRPARRNRLQAAARLTAIRPRSSKTAVASPAPGQRFRQIDAAGGDDLAGLQPDAAPGQLVRRPEQDVERLGPVLLREQRPALPAVDGAGQR